MRHSTESRLPPPANRPRRVAFCITELDRGGAEQQFVRLVTEIDRGEFTPEAICLSGRGELVASLEQAGVPVTCLEARGRFDLGIVVRLCRHFRRSQPELVQSFLFHANLASRLAAAIAGVGVVVSGIRVAERRRWHLLFDRLTDRLVDRHVCVSRAVAEHSRQVGGLPAEKLIVIPNAVDVQAFASAPPADLREFGIPDASRVILFVGRLDEQKNPALLLDVFRSVAERLPDVRLLFVGTGPLLDALKSAAGDLGDRVIFAGRRRDVPSLLKAATCLALPSRWEGMPNVVLEAMAAGTPVVASDVEGIAELLQNDAAGLIVGDQSAERWSEALQSILADAQKMTQNEQKAQSILLDRFTANAMVSAYSELYRNLLEGGQSQDPAGVVRTGGARRRKN